MFTNRRAAPTNVSQSEPPKRQRNADPAERRATTVNQGVSNAGNLFGGWGPRLGN
jgi:hypothetical protein